MAKIAVSPKLRSYIVPATLVIGIILLITANLVWRAIETRPPHWDMGRHLWTSLQYLNVVRHRPSAILDAYYYYPPLIYLNAVPFYLVFGISILAAVAANNVFLIIGILAVYGIGKRVNGSTTGLLAALAYATSPLIATQFKEFQIDGPLSAMTALALWALLWSFEFKSRLRAVVLGIIMGLCLLTKWTFPGVFALPLLYAAYVLVRRSWNEKSFQRVINFGISLGIAAIIALLWYWPHRHQLKIDIMANNLPAAEREGDPHSFSYATLTYYAYNLLNVQYYLVPTLFFLAGVWQAIKRRSHELIMLLALVVSTYGFFTYVANKDARYTLPFLPAVAVLSVFWIFYLSRRWRIWLASVFAAYCVITFWAMGFGISWLPNQVVINAKPTALILWAQHGYIISQPTHENWHLEQSIRVAKNGTLWYSGPDTIWFNSWGMQYYSSIYNVTLIDQATAKFLLIRGSSEPNESGYRVLAHNILPDNTQLTLYEKN